MRRVARCSERSAQERRSSGPAFRRGSDVVWDLGVDRLVRTHGKDGPYRIRDLTRVPTLISLTRLPLAGLFGLWLDRPLFAVTILGAAGLSDIADGWYARRFQMVTAAGAVLDPIADKLFVLTVAITMILRGNCSPVDVLLLSVREVGELPLAIGLALHRRAQHIRAQCLSANLFGKATTALQFATVSTFLVARPFARTMVVATAVVGAMAAWTYWTCALRDIQRSTPNT